jgi:hypothetical protein
MGLCLGKSHKTRQTYTLGIQYERFDRSAVAFDEAYLADK